MTEGGGRKGMADKRIQSYRDLKVYKLAFALQQEIFSTTKQFPREELFALTDQIRRSSQSIGANIAESWQKQRYPTPLCQQIVRCDGEQAETQHWLITSLACNYISSSEYENLLDSCGDIGKMLGKMMQEPEKWCVSSQIK